MPIARTMVVFPSHEVDMGEKEGDEAFVRAFQKGAREAHDDR